MADLRRVVVGGTFDVLHAGHRALLTEAARNADRLFVGLAADSLAAGKGRRIRPFAAREWDLRGFLDTLHVPYEVRAIDHPHGGAAAGDYTDIVVSPETRGVADEINAVRRQRGLAELAIHIVAFLMAEDGEPISATRIAAGAIDGEGRVVRRR